jgi:uridylate kinase
MSPQKTIIISLGGSLVAPPEGINVDFIKKFKKFILAEIKNGYKFYLVVGGGATARQYCQAANQITKLSSAELDWIGIRASRLNAFLIKSIFGSTAYSEVIIDPLQNITTKKNITIAAGWKPGWSTDYVATKLAEKNNIKTIINLSNINYVYSADPRIDKNAQPLTQISWPNFCRLVGNKWKPGLNSPFDPIASRLAKKLNLEVAIINGQKFPEIKKYLKQKNFQGTLIS